MRFRTLLRWAPLLAFVAIMPTASSMGERPGVLGERSLSKLKDATSSLSKRFHDSHDSEGLLVQTLLSIKEGKLNDALTEIEKVLSLSPNFRLAHLIRGDLLTARAQAIAQFGSAPGASAQQISDLREEAHQRLQHYLEEPAVGRIPRYLLQMQPEQQYALVVDTSKSRLYLYQNLNGEPHYVTDYYVSSGKRGWDKMTEGDQKTPLGVYFVTGNLPVAKLGDFYGSAAFPISYPNEWDRRLGRNGHGIWLHGTPSDTFSRPPRASNGCVVLNNRDMTALGKMLQVGLTPVVISENVEWLDNREWRSERDAFSRQLENWRRAWESRDTEAYLAYYSRNFKAGGQGFEEFAAQKRQVASSKNWVKVSLGRTSVFRYPSRENIMVVTFDQDYRSNNVSSQMRKRQYWMQENGQWKIVYEGGA